MPKKKNEETVEETLSEAGTTEAAEETAVEAAAVEEAPKKSSRKKAAKAEADEETSVVEEVTEAVSKVASAVSDAVSSVVSAVAGTDGKAAAKSSKRAERVGVVVSDKMTKTVVVRVDRLLKHPKYRKYVRRKKNFMAHDEKGTASVGDKVRIVETRPLSARKRWRVVDIIQKAQK